MATTRTTTITCKLRHHVIKIVCQTIIKMFISLYSNRLGSTKLLTTEICVSMKSTCSCIINSCKCFIYFFVLFVMKSDFHLALQNLQMFLLTYTLNTMNPQFTNTSIQQLAHPPLLNKCEHFPKTYPKILHSLVISISGNGQD